MLKNCLLFAILALTLSQCNCLKDQDGLPSSDIVKVYSDSKGIIWVSTPVGLSSYNGNRWKNYTSEDLGTTAYIYDITGNEQGYVWLATSDGLVELKTSSDIIKKHSIYNLSNSGLLNNNIKVVSSCPAGFVVAGTTSGISILFNNQWTNYPGNFDNICAAACTSTGRVFTVAYKDRVLMFTFVNNAIANDTTFYIPKEDNTTVTEIFTVYTVSDSSQWFGTSEGVAHHKGLNMKENWTFFTKDDGLVDNEVLSILKDNEGNMWFGTSNGVSCFDGSTFKNYQSDFKLFKGSSGPVYNVIHTLALALDGSIWMGTCYGLSHYNKGKWTKHTRDVASESSGDDDDDWD